MIDIKALRRRFHTLIKQAGVTEEERRAILDGAGVTSSNDLTEAQLQTVCDSLQSQVDNKYNASLAVRRLRSRVIDYLVKNGYYVAGGSWDKANTFLENKRIAGKRLYLLTESELKKLVAKLAIMEAKSRDAIDADNAKARWN
ncbi:MAG: DUF1018 domain-containing protein [Saprospiraceae bacterium]|nr:DUF1018 domain-containing protein [Saprospiraceae bacterium]